jgi:hypothetical protein
VTIANNRLRKIHNHYCVNFASADTRFPSSCRTWPVSSAKPNKPQHRTHPLEGTFVYYYVDALCSQNNNKRENDDIPTRHFPLSREVAVTLRGACGNRRSQILFLRVIHIALDVRILPTLFQVDYILCVMLQQATHFFLSFR